MKPRKFHSKSSKLYNNGTTEKNGWVPKRYKVAVLASDLVRKMDVHVHLHVGHMYIYMFMYMVSIKWLVSKNCR